MKTAIVIGATGLVGSELIHLLLQNKEFDSVRVFARRTLQVKNPKLTVYIIDFNKPDTWAHLVEGDVLFSAMGSTLKKAGGKTEQYTIDYTYQYQFAEIAAQNEIPIYVLVSAASANPDSGIFYLRMKGELERDVKKLPFRSSYFLQPSLLVGNRKNNRLAEKLGFYVMAGLNAVGLFKKFKPIKGKTVAQAMINASLKAENGVHVFALNKIFKLAASVLKEPSDNS